MKRMANLTVPIQVNLPDDWIEQVVDRLRNDPESEWVEIVRCKECMYAPTGDSVNHHLEFPDDTGICPCQCLDDNWYSWKPDDNFYCGHGKMKEGETE